MHNNIYVLERLPLACSLLPHHSKVQTSVCKNVKIDNRWEFIKSDLIIKGIDMIGIFINVHMDETF